MVDMAIGRFIWEWPYCQTMVTRVSKNTCLQNPGRGESVDHGLWYIHDDTCTNHYFITI
jgi:hypothetical protein